MDRQRLKGKLRELGKTYKECADELHISLTSFTNKMNGKSEFTLPQAHTLSIFLDLSIYEKVAIFL